MKKITITIILFSFFNLMKAQELFVFTEPASNMAKGNLGIRFMTSVMDELKTNKQNAHLMPELMYGINNKLMVHLTGFASNRNKSFVFEGGSFYTKYKFLNRDDVHKHFRMATFGRVSLNNADIHQQEINLFGHNSGYELGINATQLLHKLAISGGISYIKAINNGYKNDFPKAEANQAAYYTLSFGRLILPKVYKDYKQTNVNLMCEFLGQTLIQNKLSYLDVAPSIQFIIKSKMRLDLAYRYELYSDMQRTAPKGFLIRFEYNFFNVY